MYLKLKIDVLSFPIFYLAKRKKNEEEKGAEGGRWDTCYDVDLGLIGHDMYT